ncbi:MULTISPECIES: isopenicillin N synthase family dioxygenase [unclassified Nostoc]|uniref:isopenicillin N synthase family dioxygenase n=1 Tax=unclassified Nostoc TaxID=2593658 RepID=UPI002AD2968D|nr:2-oxoglutarate and iron-dependent oxygenase domain-containing protein [Nostoc sp. DedQUE03]MDZ7976979.1 2-oxoglutarate and iron-dependent oxygenase domain-containing protein [Nostoc sp. DedQUE03]MDZ8043271.1 2-oxoglutarate and iron-dependent oxygenase domain-containing protein [Nostoc sp. DedQUE02]
MVIIPVIDLTAFINGNAATRQAVVKQIYQACHEIGFIYLQNSGISKDLIKEVFTHSKSFFNLPLEVKQKQAWSDEFSNTGYVGMEREHLDPNKPGDLKEALNLNKQTAVGIDVSIVAFYDSCTELANTILQAYASALELPKDFFTIRHNQQNHTLRSLHYPPLQIPPKPGQVRAGEHSDYGSITLLFQDDVGGLEVQTASGEWIAAPAIPDTVIVNTGDLMERWTNHVFCSTKHRVMIPCDNRVNQSRYSIAFFCHPNDDTEIACLESCQKEQSPIYPPILAGEYLLQRLQATYDNS